MRCDTRAASGTRRGLGAWQAGLARGRTRSRRPLRKARRRLAILLTANASIEPSRSRAGAPPRWRSISISLDGVGGSGLVVIANHKAGISELYRNFIRSLPEVYRNSTGTLPERRNSSGTTHGVRGISRRAVVCSSPSSWHSAFGVMLLTRSWALGKGPVRSV